LSQVTRIQELRTLIAQGRYRPPPAEIAAAMLRRPAVRALLSDALRHTGERGRSSRS
jgi:Anti-sigma-28 factor, FlgM